jgi:hypothetical protein
VVIGCVKVSFNSLLAEGDKFVATAVVLLTLIGGGLVEGRVVINFEVVCG